MCCDLVIAMTSQGLEPWCTPVHTSRCAMSKQSVWLRCVVSTTPPGQEPMPVVAVYRLLRKRCAYEVVEVLSQRRSASGSVREWLMVEDRDSPPP